jgi:pimeloyl-ACP methyl ester carboxylesterase
MRAGFAHYGTMLADGRENRAHFTRPLSMPMLVLNGEHGLLQGPLLSGVQQVATMVQADIVPASGHTFAQDNPEWIARRLHRFFTLG